MIKSEIFLWKIIGGNRRLYIRVGVRIRVILFYSELAPTDPWCNTLQTLFERKKHEEAISDEHPIKARLSTFVCNTFVNLLIMMWSSTNWYWNRSSCPKVFCKNDVLKKFRQIHRKTSVSEWLQQDSIILASLAVWKPLQSLKLQISRLFRVRSFLIFMQIQGVNSLRNSCLTW